jgi:hypothetical protein
MYVKYLRYVKLKSFKLFRTFLFLFLLLNFKLLIELLNTFIGRHDEYLQYTNDVAYHLYACQNVVFIKILIIHTNYFADE